MFLFIHKYIYTRGSAPFALCAPTFRLFLCVCPSAILSVCLSVDCQSVSLYLSVNLSVYLFIYLYIFTSVSMSVCLTIYPYVCLCYTVCLSLCLSTYVCVCVSRLFLYCFATQPKVWKIFVTHFAQSICAKIV